MKELTHLTDEQQSELTRRGYQVTETLIRSDDGLEIDLQTLKQSRNCSARPNWQPFWAFQYLVFGWCRRTWHRKQRRRFWRWPVCMCPTTMHRLLQKWLGFP